MGILDRLEGLDRRIIWLILIICLAYIAASPLGLPIPISDRSQSYYDYVESFPAGTKVLLTIESGTGDIGVPEQYPSYVAVIIHMIRKGFKLIFMSSVGVDDSMLMVDYLARVEWKSTFDQMGYVYGVDWVNVGWIGGGEAGLAEWCKDPLAYRSTDWQNNDMTTWAIWDGIETVSDFEIWVMMSREVTDPACLMRQINSLYGLQALTITSSSVAGEFLAYENSGQAINVLYGAQLGAEYEKLIGRPGLGSASTDQLSFLALFTIAVIILGNIPVLARMGQPKEAAVRRE